LYYKIKIILHFAYSANALKFTQASFATVLCTLNHEQREQQLQLLSTDGLIILLWESQ